MKKKKIISLGLLLSLCLTLSVLTFGSAFAEEDIHYYGREIISTLPNSKAILFAYDSIAEGVEGYLETIELSDGSSYITVSELDTVIDLYLRDHPEHFWLGNQYSYSYSSDKIISISFKYAMTGEELREAKQQFDAAVESILSSISTKGKTEFEIELAIHDKLAEKIEYVLTDNCHNAYGALVNGQAVCDGYSKAMQYLLQKCGIQSFIATGKSINPSTGRVEGHAWNYVLINGSYYQTDLTWNDQGDRLFHVYFNRNTSFFSGDHQIDEVQYPLPECNAQEDMYFNKMGVMFEDGKYSTQIVGSALKNNDYCYSFYVPDHAEDFINWVKKNIIKIAAEAGIYGMFQYMWAYLDDEVFIIIPHEKCDHSSMLYIRSIEASCKRAGTKAYYICECGKMFFDKSATQEFSDILEISVAPLGHDYKEKITDEAHLRKEGENCLEADTYWYDCTRCSANAGEDGNGASFYYSVDSRGEHSYTKKIAHPDYLVKGSGEDCMSVKKYYFLCIYCDALGSATWDSDEKGGHKLSDKWSSSEGAHFHECTVDGCGYKDEPMPCRGGEATCLSLAICSVCNNRYGSLGQHVDGEGYQQNENSHATSCKLCGFVTSSESHTDNDGDGKCDVCQYVIYIIPDTPIEPPVEPTPVPTETPDTVPTDAPTSEPTEEPPVEPTPVPTETPDTVPADAPTSEPTEEPPVEPTPVPTETPDTVPTDAPTSEPTEEPPVEPTPVPTETPDTVPTDAPTLEPTEEPPVEPTPVPTETPDTVPTDAPTSEPTEEPPVEPTPVPTETPDTVPTDAPTSEPTEEPPVEPTPVPTETPKTEPTEAPTLIPTEEPTAEPTPVPTETLCIDPVTPFTTPAETEEGNTPDVTIIVAAAGGGALVLLIAVIALIKKIKRV